MLQVLGRLHPLLVHFPIALVLAALAAVVSAWRWLRTADPAFARPTRAGLVLTAVLVACAGHFGGTLVFGEGFVLEPLEPLEHTERALELLPSASTDPAQLEPPA